MVCTTQIDTFFGLCTPTEGRRFASSIRVVGLSSEALLLFKEPHKTFFQSCSNHPWVKTQQLACFFLIPKRHEKIQLDSIFELLGFSFGKKVSLISVVVILHTIELENDMVSLTLDKNRVLLKMVCFIDSIFKILVSQVNIPMHCTFWTLCYEIMIEGPHLLITWVSAFLISFATLVMHLMVSPRAKVLSSF